ncbi:MAG: penicillin acylase family protein [Chloroflexota bacterium]
MNKTTRFLKMGAIILLLLILFFAGIYAFLFQFYFPVSVASRSFPQTAGEITLEGLDQAVEIYRDQMGIPHIYASTLHDLFFAQGYVHAQDRFWQMDFWRHIGSGRLAEMFGASQVETDAFLRTLGWRQIAEQEYGLLSDESRAILTAYSEGVNAYLKDHSGEALSLEYAILKYLAPDYQVEDWTPIHTLTWAKAMAWDLRGNMGEEIQRAILLRSMTPEQVEELFPPYPQDHPVIVESIGGETRSAAPQPDWGEYSWLNDEAALAAVEKSARRFAQMDSLIGSGQGLGSNSWVISGERTSTGKPFLANDPHLGIQMPSIWYQVGLHCQPKSELCPFEVAGFSFAGVPGVVIGHNDWLAWGFTNVGPDVIDLYMEKVNPQNPDQYAVNGEWVNFETRQEVIRVSGGEAVEMTVRWTRHGPVISDTYAPLQDKVDPQDKTARPFREKAGIELPEPYVITMRWTALEPALVFEAIWGFNKAQSWQEFRQAASQFAVPAQNLVYADVDGNIGYQMPGKIPIRARGDGRLPAPGWTDEFEWTGYIPFEELPYTLNPPSGYIVTANNRVSPWDYPYLITTDWDYGFRAQRIVEMIENAPAKIDAQYIQQMHGDAYDSGAETIVPLLLAVSLDDSRLEEVRALLQGWDYQAAMDSAPAALYETFWRRLLLDTFSDDLPEDYWPEGGDRWFEILRSVAQNPDSFWWDDQTTSGKVEQRDDILRKAFAEAVQELERNLGKNPEKWRWGVLHTATFRNQTLGESGIPPLEGLFNRGPFETGGGASIVNATGWDAAEGFAVDWLPSMRMIVDLSNLNRSLTIHTTGQSGHAFHSHYIDMADYWRTIQYMPMWWDKTSVLENTEAVLRLQPLSP